jgi:hypothetical protein
MKLFILLLIAVFLSTHNNVFSQKTDCDVEYGFTDNGFDEPVRTVYLGNLVGPMTEINTWPKNATYKGYYSLGFSFAGVTPPQLIGGNQDKIDATIKVNGILKKYSFATSSSGMVLKVVGSLPKAFLNDLKIGSELNVVFNYGKSYQSKVYHYNLKCSTSCITKLMAP